MTEQWITELTDQELEQRIFDTTDILSYCSKKAAAAALDRDYYESDFNFRRADNCRIQLTELGNEQVAREGK